MKTIYVLVRYTRNECGCGDNANVVAVVFDRATAEAMASANNDSIEEFELNEGSGIALP